MDITEYIKNLNRLKALAVDRWGNLTTLERDVVDSSFEWLVDNLEIKRGEVQIDEDLAKTMDDFLGAVVQIVNNNQGFQTRIGKFLADLNSIQNNNKTFHATTHNFNIDIAGVTDVQKAVVNEIIEQYTGNGLNAHFAAPLKDSIFRNMLAGASMNDVKQVLRDYILSGQDQSGKLGQYLDQTAQQAVDSYTGAINQALVETFKFTGYIISGSLIETSSKQCVFAVERSKNGYMTFDQWEEVLSIARNNPKAKLIEGTTIKNLPINKLHWGCRHDFTPVIKKEEVKTEPVKVEKKEVPVEAPVKVVKPRAKKAQGLQANTINQAKEIAQKLLEEKGGFKIGSVKVAREMSLEKLNNYIKKLDELLTEYNVGPALDKTNPVELQFSSTRRALGFVRPGDHDAKSLVQINFGNKNDPNRSAEVSETLVSFIPKSRVDKENQEISTAVHEFGHVISLSQQSNFNKPALDFWSELTVIKAEYNQEVRTLQDSPELNNIYLGKYASHNINEFMAEGFTEYKLRKNPSKYAKKIGLLIDKYFKK